MQSLKSYLNLTSDVHWSDPDPCKWDGVICGENNRITRILLREKGITETLPQDLGKLSDLVEVDLLNNDFSGPIPDLSGLQYLRSFNLATAWRGNDPCDSWPGITCSGSDVTVVNLRRFELTGTITPSFAKLTSLETIDLSNNNLIGSISTKLTTLPMLRTVNVSINNINGAVPTFSASVNVVTSGNANIGKDGPVSHPLLQNNIHAHKYKGFEATLQIRVMEKEAKEKTKLEWHLPILAKTADVTHATYEECLKSGMDGYVSNPFEEENLYESVAKSFKANPISDSSCNQS
ncbi:unnamed protein product [Brassica napus]|uniref:(rape) hypothetical protein n=1 Tax=Brassica napus TaxID=3708 RepID=A0A816SX31_BRANA|nr:unnamed protein product [Brassica napus]